MAGLVVAIMAETVVAGLEGAVTAAVAAARRAAEGREEAGRVTTIQHPVRCT